MRIRAVVGNLPANALRYTPEGGAVSVGARLDGPMLAVIASDTGRGIPRAKERPA